MRTAPAQVLGERGADLFFSRIARRLQERGRLHDHAVDAVAALHRLLGDERPLERMRPARGAVRSEEHTSELQSLTNLVCRLLLEKKKKKNKTTPSQHTI